MVHPGGCLLSGWRGENRARERRQDLLRLETGSALALLSEERS